MSPFFTFLGPIFGLGFTFYVWLYMLPLCLFIITAHFFKDAVLVLFRRDLPIKVRAAQARYAAGQGLLGCVLCPASAYLIFHRAEVYECIAGLF